MEKHFPALESLIKRLEEENQKVVARNLVLESVHREQRRLLDEKPEEDILKVKSERDGVSQSFRKLGEEYVKVKHELERGEKKCKMRVAELEKRRWNSEAEIKKMETDLQAERRAAKTEIGRMRGLVEAMAREKRVIEVQLRDRVLKLEEQVYNRGEEGGVGVGVALPISSPLKQEISPPMVAIVEKPHTTVFVGKIPSMVENDFVLSLLQFCGPVKRWRRPEDPSNGTPKAFGFCEFESADGVLRSLRLLSRVQIDGQELKLNVSEATRDYLKRHSKPAVEDLQDKNESGSKENDMFNFGLVSDEDHEGDREAKEKIATAIEKRWKSRPLPPPPPLTQKNDVIATSKSEGLVKSVENDSDFDVKKVGMESPEWGRRCDGRGRERGRDRLDRDMKLEKERELARIEREMENSVEKDSDFDVNKAGTESPERGRRCDGRGRERDRDRDMKREKGCELARIEREMERERGKRERERQQEIRKSELWYKERVKEWETKEKEREYQQKYEREMENAKECYRRKLVQDHEDESDDYSRRRRRRSDIEGKRRKWRQRERQADLADRLKEEEEIAEAKKRAGEEQEEDQKQMGREALQRSSAPIANETSPETDSSGTVEHGSNDDTKMTLDSASDMRISANAPTKKSGFGIAGLEKDGELLHKDEKTRPLVPIDYSAKELQGTDPCSTPPNTALAADAAKHTTMASKDEGSETENNNVMDAKQLIDMIPKTKEELFSYDINWVVYDKHGLQERMRPWIVKKITEFLGEEETTLLDYIMSSIQDHVTASQMQDQLHSILDEETEMFVLDMWRMLICEIKRVEIGLTSNT